MAKTYMQLDHNEPLSAAEIRRQYKGYWVYIVKAQFGAHGELLSGIPVIIGEIAADGAEDGIYEKYRSDEYEIRAGLNLLTNRGFISSLRIVGDNIE